MQPRSATDTNDTNGKLLTTEEAARYLTMSVASLCRMRVTGDSPKYCKLGPRRVAYRLSDLEEWVAARVRRSTSEGAGR
jgi:predicted DNA-binding transcriptional regulator AlpA